MRGPMIGAVTAGWWSSQAWATSAGRSPSSAHRASHGSQLGAVRLDLAPHVLLAAAARLDLLQRAGEQAARQRAVADQAHAVLLHRGDHLELDACAP